MSTYLVTGAAGFIASRVSQLLLADGHSVIGIDNLNDAYDERLNHWRLSQLCERPGFRFQHLDICHRHEVCELFLRNQFDGVINLAARAGVRQSLKDPWCYYETNNTGVLNLLEACKTHGVNKFVLASSSSLYGKDNPMPWQEEQNTNLPLSPYAASKKAAETLCFTYHHLYGIDITVFRYFTVYGPAGRPDMSPFRFVQWISEGRPVHIFGDGMQQRDFTYVDDIARGTIAGLQPVGYEVINLGSDEPVTLLDMIHLIEENVGQEAQLCFEEANAADTPATWANIHKAESLLGWRPQYTLRDGIAQLATWYQDNRQWARNVQTI